MAYIEERFLPILKLHPDDKFRPAPVDWMLPQAELYYKDKSNRILGAGAINATNLSQQKSPGGTVNSGGGTAVTDFFIDYPDDKARAGTLDEVLCYVHMSKQENPVEIQYWFYYPYNGSIAPSPFDLAHEGDWEHITVIVNPERTALTRIFYYAHERKYSNWVDAKPEYLNDEGRPIVYSALHTHGSYPAPGEWNIAPTDVTGIKDKTKDGGPVIDYRRTDCWKSLDAFLDGFEWVDYNGNWGEPGLTPASKGFPGPKFQPEWQGDPR